MDYDDDLESLFERAEENALVYDWNWRSRAIRLYDSSTVCDEESLKHDIAIGEWNEVEIRQLFERLQYNQTRPIDKKTWGKTELARWMKHIFNLNT